PGGSPCPDARPAGRGVATARRRQEGTRNPPRPTARFRRPRRAAEPAVSRGRDPRHRRTGVAERDRAMTTTEPATAVCWHVLSRTDVLGALGTETSGLTEAEAARRVMEH